MQVIYMCTTLILLWSFLQHVEYHDLFMQVSAQLEVNTRNIFIQHDRHRTWSLDWPSITLGVFTVLIITCIDTPFLAFYFTESLRLCAY
jgi:hypothetical protein